MADERGLSTHDVTFAAAGVALMAVASWVTVPVGVVPFTLQTMAVTFVALALRPKAAIASMLAYVLVGAVGVPVFSGMSGGVGVLFGPTGGFIIGFVVAKAFVCVLLVVIMYAFGWAWLMASAGMGPAAAFAAACAPFILPDVVKVAVGAGLAEAVTAAVPALTSEA